MGAGGEPVVENQVTAKSGASVTESMTGASGDADTGARVVCAAHPRRRQSWRLVGGIIRQKKNVGMLQLFEGTV